MDGTFKPDAKVGIGASHFHVMVTGSVESAQFEGVDNLYCKYDFSCGQDWNVVQGLEWGVSQLSMKGSSGDNTIGSIWNFPIDITFKSSNAHGWPKAVISIFGLDGLGRDIVRGYASMHIPTVPGTYTRYLHAFTPTSSSPLQDFIAWLTGNRPEFFNAKFVTEGEGRELTRVRSAGIIKVKINVMTRGMESFGFSTAKRS